MRRALRNLWRTLRATSSLWTTRSGKVAKGSAARIEADRTFAAHGWKKVRAAGLRPERLPASDGKRTPSRPVGVRRDRSITAI
jgi:hypothetical protein